MRTSGGFHGRRIQKTGGSTYIISLPKSWVVDRGLHPGDVLQFTPRADGTLTVYAEGGSRPGTERRRVEITNDIPYDHLFRLLVSEYIAGAPLLEIHTPNRMSAPTREVIRGFAQRMIGPEILEETDDSVILQDVIGPNPLPIPSVIRRMHQMVRAMHSDAMAALHDLDPAIARDVVDRDWEVDRLHWFVGKQVTTALRDARALTSIGLSLPECATYLQVSRVLERIADHAVRIAGTIEMLGRDKPPEAIVVELDRLAKAAGDALRGALEALEKKDIAAANTVLDEVAHIPKERQQILHQLLSKRGRLAVALAYVLESLERSALYASDLAEIAINHAVESLTSSSVEVA